MFEGIKTFFSNAVRGPGANAAAASGGYVIANTTPGTLGDAPTGTPFSFTLGPSNSISPAAPIVGAFSIPGANATWQQPATEPPRPVKGFKSIVSQEPISPAPKPVTPLFSPAPHYSPFGL
jgi:hypothetical protein